MRAWLLGGAELAWLLGGAALALAVCGWQYLLLRRRLGRGRSALLAALRALAVALVLGALAAPRLVRSAQRRIPRPLAVAVDVSRSMALSGGLPQARLDRVRALLQSPAFSDALAGWVPEYFAIGEDVVKIPAGGLPALRADRPGADIASAPAKVAAQAAAGTAAVVMFTDGGGSPGPAPGAGPAAGLPLVVVGVGAGERPRDIEIAAVEGPGIAFAGQPATVRVRVRATGLGRGSVTVLLKRGAQVLASQGAAPGDGGDPAEVALTWTPPSPGSHPLTVEVPVQEGEQITENNRADLVLEAQRDKIRVLLVSGTPSWSYRFLRGALKGDPSVDLVSFIILRSASDAVDVPQQELSLIPFPTERIFLEELPNFDLLVFDDFAYEPYLPAAYLTKVRDFVRGGGAFWMLGGPRSFLGGRYQASALAELLPLALPESLPAEGGFREIPLVPRLTAAGRNHPFFQGLSDGAARLPPLDGLNVVGAARPGATILAEAQLPDGTAAPLVASGRFGAGRTIAVTTDSLWRWGFEEAGRGRGGAPYLAFVRQAVRWSVGDPQLQPIRVEPERTRIAPGGRIRATVRVLGDDYLPAGAAAVSVTLRGPVGGARALVAERAAPGVFRVEADAPEAGAWEIAAESGDRRAAATVTAAWPDEELSAAGPDREALRGLVAQGRGAVLELSDPVETAAALARALEELAPPADDTRTETRTPAQEPWFFLLFLGVAGAEWVVRRRSGLD